MGLLDYTIVLLASIAVLYIYPSVIFNKLLIGKKLMYKIFFNVGISIVLWNFIFTILGTIGFLNQLFTFAIFYCSFLAALVVIIFQYINNHGSFKLVDIFKNLFSKCCKMFKRKEDIYIFCINCALAIMIIILCFHFCDYAMSNNAYGFSDMKRHDSWMKQLVGGALYANGVYPFGMHFIGYLINSVFGISIHVINLYLGNVLNIVLFLSIIYWAREIFSSKSCVILLFVLLLVYTFSLNTSTNELKMVHDGLHRLRWTLPQEFALWTAFVGPVCLINIFKSKNLKNDKDYIFNVILLSITIGAAFCVHYYTVMFEFVLCLSVCIVYIFKFNFAKIKSIFLAIVCGVLSAVIPLVIAYLKVGFWSYSINWSQSVPSGDAPIAESISSVTSSSDDVFDSFLTNSTSSSSMFDDFWNHCLYPLLFFRHLDILIGVLFFVSLVALIVYLLKKQKVNKNILCAFIPFVIFLILYSAPLLNLPRLLESYRLILCLYVTGFSSLLIGFDLLLQTAENRLIKG